MPRACTMLVSYMTAALLACAPTPSATPLGEGPLARSEAARTAAAKQRARRSLFEQARASAEESRSSYTPPVTQATTEASKPKPQAGDPAAAATGGASSSQTAGADSENAGPGGVAAFVGNYTGEDSTLYTLEGLPDRTERDPNARTRVDAIDTEYVGFALVDSSTGDDICVLRGLVKARRATLEPGQHCFEQSTATVTVAAEVESGEAILKDGRLTLNMKLKVEMNVGDRATRGNLTYHFEGNRQ